MRTLVLQIPKDVGGPVSWALFEAPFAAPLRTGVVEAGAALKLDIAIDRRWAIVSGAAVTVHTVALPPEAGERKIAAAAAFALEDELAVDPAELHFAIGEAGGGTRLVAVAGHDAMAAWTDRLAALGVRVDILIPDYLAISKTPVVHDGLLLMKSESGGFAAEPELAQYILEIQGAVAQASVAALIQDAYTALPAGVPVNLLQGRYAPRRDWATILRPWRRAGSLAAGVVAAGLIGLAVEGVRLNHQAEAAAARTEAVFRTALPDVKRVVNPRAQMRAYLQSANLTGSAGFLALSDILVSATSAVPDAEIAVLRFDGKRGEIAATFSLPSFEAVERVKSEMAGRGGLVQEAARARTAVASSPI